MKNYHQYKDSQLLTTFITPFGWFKYLRAPHGISSISERYNRRMDEAFVGLTGYRCIVDDVITIVRLSSTQTTSGSFCKDAHRSTLR
jgi:hypothetical protein